MNSVTENKTIFALIVGLSVSCFYIFTCWCSVSKYGSDLLFQLGGYALGALGLMSLMMFIGIILSLVWLISPRHRPDGWSGLKLFPKVCGIFVLFIFLASTTGGLIRESAWRAITIRSQPLIDAIRHYQTTNGIPPNTLDDLVPKYISDIPATKVPAYPQFNFVRNHNPTRFGGNPWIMVVPISVDKLTCEFLIYYPNQNYPISKQGNVRDGKVRDWALIEFVTDDAKRNGFVVKDQ